MVTKKSKVFVGMSGGVDSSVAAGLLKEKYDVVGVHLRCYNVDGCAEKDAEDARRAAETLDIPFYVFDFEKEYKEKVVEYMIEGYKEGITPNPDVMCNKEIKFGLFFDRARALGADFVATGHYVRLCRKTLNSKLEILNKSQIRNSKIGNKIGYSLLTAKDENKDQSYFLWTLNQEKLKHSLFPVGDYTKAEVRKLAGKFGLHNAEKKDSQGICFLGQVNLKEFLKNYIPPKKGFIFSAKGEKVGEHEGAHYYTIGQRHGLSLGNRKQEVGNRSDFKPYYVAGKSTATNAVVIAEGNDPALYKKEIKITDVHFISSQIRHTDKLENVGVSVLCRIRYRQKLVPAQLIIHNSESIIRFDQPIKAVASGQSAVFYNKRGVMLGGGIISKDSLS